MTFEDPYNPSEEELEESLPSSRLRRIVLAFTSLVLIILILSTIIPRPRPKGIDILREPLYQPDPSWRRFRGQTIELWHPDGLAGEPIIVSELRTGDPRSPGSPYEAFATTGIFTGTEIVILVVPHGRSGHGSAAGFLREILAGNHGAFRQIEETAVNHPFYDSAGGIYEPVLGKSDLTQINYVVQAGGSYWQILVSAPSVQFWEYHSIFEEIIKSLFVLPFPVEQEVG